MNRIPLFSSLASLASLAVGLAACTGSTTPADMGGHDMAATVTQPAAFVDLADGGTAPAALDCIGTRNDPAAPTVDTVVTGQIKDFQDSNIVVGAVVSIYTDPAQVIANHPVAMSTPSDMNGMYTVTIPKGFYRVIMGNSGGKAISGGGAMAETITTYEFGRIFDDKSRVAVKTTTRDAIFGLVSIPYDATAGAVAGSVRDCAGANFGGGRASVTMTSSSFDNANIFYFKDVGGSPILVRTAKYTSGLGVFAALNVPAGNATVSATAVVGSGAPKTVGSYTVPVLAGAITIVDVIPSGPGM